MAVTVNTLKPLNRLSTGSERQTTRGLIVIVWCVIVWWRVIPSLAYRDTNKLWVLHLHALMLLLYLTASPTKTWVDVRDRWGETEEDNDNDGKWWHHIGHQGNERSKPQVNRIAENRRWVIPASLHPQPIGKAPHVTTCINTWTANQRAIVFKTLQSFKFIKKTQ